MFSFLIILYLSVTSFLVWVVLFPEGRSFLTNLFGLYQSAKNESVRGSSAGFKKLFFAVKVVTKSSLNLFGKAAKFIKKNRWHVIFWLMLVALPPAGIVIFSSGLFLEGFTDDRMRSNPQVAALLAGEQLVPPAPLPPEIFFSAEVELIRPMLQSASRNWQLLDSDFSQRLLLAFKIMREKNGYEMVLLEGYRSPERQDMLTRIGSHVTSAKAFQSYHQYGLAADCAFYLNGKLVISEKDPWAMKGYALYGEVAESVGLTWGGRWKMMDFGHIEWRKPGVMK